MTPPDTSMSIEQRLKALETWRDSVDMHINRSIPIGPCTERKLELEKDGRETLQRIVEDIKEKRKAAGEEPPPVDRNKQQLASGAPVPEDRSHTDLKSNGQQKDYIVLTPEERAKGFVRPVRRSYIHTVCGNPTSMSQEIAETYARDPKFYSGTFCCYCGKHFPLGQFVWKDTPDEQVGS